MGKEFHILTLILVLIEISFEIGCMDIDEIVKGQKAYTVPTTSKKTITMGSTSTYRSVTFYFKTNFDNTMNHMTIFSFRDKNDLSYSIDIKNQTSSTVLDIKKATDGITGTAERQITDKEWYFVIFEWKFDNGGTQSLKTVIYHPTGGQTNILQVEGAFDYTGDVKIYLGGNYNDMDTFSKKNNFKGEINHVYRYTGHVDTILNQVLKINKMSWNSIDYTRQSFVSQKIISEKSNKAYASKTNSLIQTNLDDIRRFSGTSTLDLRDGFKALFSSFNEGGYLFSNTISNIFQLWYYLKIKVYDAITEYTLPDGTSFTESQRTQKIFQLEEFDPHLSGNVLHVGFYHKLTSTHLSVSSGGNKHESYFYFKAGISGELCKSDPIVSLNSDLGLEWVYVKIMRDMWSTDYSFIFRTNLMANDCVVLSSSFDPNYEFSGAIFRLGGTKSFIQNKPRVFYYDIQLGKIGTGGDLFIESDTRDCLTFLDKGVGYFSNSHVVLKCPAGKIRVLEECLDPPSPPNGCIHDGSPCKACELGYALDIVLGTCHQCPSDCETCKYNTGVECTVCNEKFMLSSGSCVACTSNEVWDSVTFRCLPATELTLQSGYTYNGLTTPGTPFSNQTYLAIEAKFTVGPTGTYEQEQIIAKVNGNIKEVFQNISSPLFSYTDNSYIIYITIPSATKFDTFSLEFGWDASSPDEVVSVDYVKVYSKTRDFTEDCLIPAADGTCELCNKYKLRYRDNSGICQDNKINSFLYATDYSRLYGLQRSCADDGSVKYCWGKNGGAAECTNNNWLLIDGYCKGCDPRCQGCQSATSGPNTESNLYNCFSCPPGNIGFKTHANGTKTCETCESLSCTSCAADYQVCTDCKAGYEKREAKCWLICEENFYNTEEEKCGKCHENCAECQSGGLNGCLSCSSGKLRSQTNCSDSSKGFCCYDCPETCLDCSFDGICSSCKNPLEEADKEGKCVLRRSDEKITITQAYFMKSKGEVVIIFDKIFSIKTLEGKYQIETTKEVKHSNCSLENSLTDECRITILENEKEVKDSQITFTVTDMSLVEHKEERRNFTISGQKTVTLPEINFYTKSKVVENLKTIGTVASFSVRLSFGTLLATEQLSFLHIMKLTQYIEFMLYFNVDYPTNLYNFLNYFNQGFFEVIKNPFRAFHDERCRPPTKFVENGALCYYFDNLGLQYFGFGIVLIFKLIFSVFANISDRCRKDKNEKTWLMIINSSFNSSVFIYVMDMFYFELVLFSSLQLKRLNFKNFYLSFNALLAFASLAFCLLLMFVTFFYSKNLIDRKLNMFRAGSEKNMKWIYKVSIKFFFEDLNLKNFVGRYFVLIIQIRNFLNGFLVVFLYKNGLAQVIIHLLINGGFLGLIIWKRPYESKVIYARDLILTTLLVSTLILSLFLTDSLRPQNEKFVFEYFGNIGVILFGIIFLNIFVFSIYETVMKIVDMIQKLRGKFHRRKARRRTVVLSIKEGATILNCMSPIQRGVHSIQRSGKEEEKKTENEEEMKKINRTKDNKIDIVVRPKFIIVSNSRKVNFDRISRLREKIHTDVQKE